MKSNRNWMYILLTIFLFATISACAPESNETENKDIETEQTEDQDSDKAITINDQTFLYEDLDFYKLMNEIKIDLQLAIDLEEIDEEEKEERVAYWSERLEYYENINVNLQSLIEMFAMSALAEEKNYFVPEDKLEQSVDEYKEQIEQNKQAADRVKDYGEQKFNRNIHEYVRQVTLRDRIATELRDEIIEENPEASEIEISYLLEDKFESLYGSQLVTLDLDIHIK